MITIRKDFRMGNREKQEIRQSRNRGGKDSERARGWVESVSVSVPHPPSSVKSNVESEG